MLVVGPNGAGKTNLLEALHVGTQGFSPRTRNDARLIRFGREGARIALTGDRAGSPLELNVTPYTIPGALWIAADDIDRRHLEIPRDRDIVVFCT